MEITVEELNKIKKYHCDKGKHKFRTNHFGITWCVLCGQLSNSDAPLVEENEKIKIII